MTTCKLLLVLGLIALACCTRLARDSVARSPVAASGTGQYVADRRAGAAVAGRRDADRRLLDYALQRWKHERQLMMTREELKQESREEQGDPQVRSRQRKLQREAARNAD